jgi:hypothetical protein
MFLILATRSLLRRKNEKAAFSDGLSFNLKFRMN